jgi:hypothetical protein
VHEAELLTADLVVKVLGKNKKIQRDQEGQGQTHREDSENNICRSF